MDTKSQIIVRRFIDGEKQLQSKLKDIHSNLTESDNSVYDLYLKAFFNDDIKEIFLQKKNILQLMPLVKNKFKQSKSFKTYFKKISKQQKKIS